MGFLMVAMGSLLALGAINRSEMNDSQFVSANDHRFRFEGRFDQSNATGSVAIWQGSRISIDFGGSYLALRFANPADQNYFNVEVDGVNTIVSANHDGPLRIEVPVTTMPHRHKLLIVKRSEAAKGHVAFEGIEVAKGAQVWSSANPKYRLKMEFFGDSITAGACNEDGATDQWDNFRTHNHTLSYGYLTSQALHADHRAMAVSGMGVTSGYVDILAGQVWNKLYPDPASNLADLKSWQPDVAFVNLGENDLSFNQTNHRPLPPNFVDKYVELVKAIRTAYPQAEIVLLRGGMWGGSQSPELKAAWDSAVRRLEASDKGVQHFAFAHWSGNHPRVADHRAMADELTSWLRNQSFMKRFL